MTGRRLDFDLDLSWDYDPNESFPCVGDPLVDNPNHITDEDWVADVYIWELCEPDTLTNRSSELDWMRYLWLLITEEDMTTQDIWGIIDDADTRNWCEDDDTPGGTCADENDYPYARWNDAIVAAGFNTEHANQKGQIDH